MQETRQRILEILKTRGQATVNELSEELGLTAVTIRHHLEILRSRGLVAPPQALRKKRPGRPQHVYRLAEASHELFPKSYDRLAEAVLAELEEWLSPEEMEKLVGKVAKRMAAMAEVPESEEVPIRLDVALEFLNGLGYLASVERTKKGEYLLHIANCPYEQVARRHTQLCRIDERMIARLLGLTPERLEKIINGDDRCTYRVPSDETAI